MMFNLAGIWVLMEQHRQSQIRQAYAVRLAEEAMRDHLSPLKRTLLSVSTLLIDSGLRLKARCGEFGEQPHQYLAAPQDRVFT